MEKRKDNETMMQYFEWYLPNDGLLWKRVTAKAKKLSSFGITQVWLPPAYKGTSQSDTGYGVYDMYDLGEFDQKGTVRTKYGTKKEYQEAIQALHRAGIQVLADIVINQKMGADETEEVDAIEVAPNDRNKDISGEQKILAWTKFTFPGRQGKYSDFIWTAKDFSGTDWDERTKRKAIFRFAGKHWNTETDSENGNYDYLMGADVDTDSVEVREQLKKWIIWYHQQVGFDGVRLDAVKHISFDLYRDVLREVRAHAARVGKEILAVGEYWSADLQRLTHYLDVVEENMSLFDVPLHFNFYNASHSGGQYPMRDLLANTLVSVQPQNAVTFVDNHDTEPGQALESFVEPWFKPIAYAVILLRNQGTPCIFYGDYYGIPSRGIAPTANLQIMVQIRHRYAYGPEDDYFNDDNIVGFVRRGDTDHPGSGLAVVMSDGAGGTKRMEMGTAFAGMKLYDATGACTEPVTVEADGWGTFPVTGGSVSVYVTQAAYEELALDF